MTLKEVFLILSLIGFVSCIALVLYYFYSYKGKRTFKVIALSFIIPIIFVLLYPVYTSVSSLVFNSRYNTFSVSIGDRLEKIDYLDLYDQIYEKSNADSDLIISKYHKNIKIFIDNSGKITEYSIKIVVPKYDKYFLYTSYYDGEKLIFLASKSVEEYGLGEHHNFLPYIKRMNALDDNIIVESFANTAYINGSGVEVNFNYYSKSTQIPLTNDPFFDKFHRAYDDKNQLCDEEVVEVINEEINLKLSYLPKVVDENTHKLYDVIKIFEKEYYYRTKDTIELINFGS